MDSTSEWDLVPDWLLNKALCLQQGPEKAISMNENVFALRILQNICHDTIYSRSQPELPHRQASSGELRKSVGQRTGRTNTDRWTPHPPLHPVCDYNSPRIHTACGFRSFFQGDPCANCTIQEMQCSKSCHDGLHHDLLLCITQSTQNYTTQLMELRRVLKHGLSRFKVNK